MLSINEIAVRASLPEITGRVAVEKYTEDAAGHQHDPHTGQFTGTGGGGGEAKPDKKHKPPKGLTPHIDNILGHIHATGMLFLHGHQTSGKDRAAASKARELGWIKSIPDPDNPGKN
jgi:hypothetical protein